MSFTSFMTLSGVIVAFGSWFLIGLRAKASPNGASYQVKMLLRFFLFLGIFLLIMYLPQVLITTNPDAFPLAMAWGYVIGHIFLYIGFIYTLCLTFSMVPRLANKQLLPIIFMCIYIVALTAFNAYTMIWGTLPVYDEVNRVILFNAHPLVGASIGLLAAFSVLPAAVLLIRNGIRNPHLRARSILLGTGLFVIMTAGPLHDNAHSWQFYLVADILSTVGLFVLAAGVLYRFEERLVPTKLLKKKSRTAFSRSSI